MKIVYIFMLRNNLLVGEGENMYISEIEIEGLRGFGVSKTIRFNEGINVIIGHNNSGKTTILKALDLVFGKTSKQLSIDEFKIRKKKNIIQDKKFSEMLSNIIERYHNNQIDAAQVLEELANMDKEMRLEDNNANELGLTGRVCFLYDSC